MTTEQLYNTIEYISYDNTIALTTSTAAEAATRMEILSFDYCC